MKKSELRKMIREEISFLREADTIKNPDTGRTIKVSTALSYPKDSKVYKLAASKKSTSISTDQPNTTKDVQKK